MTRKKAKPGSDRPQADTQPMDSPPPDNIGPVMLSQPTPPPSDAATERYLMGLADQALGTKDKKAA